ncbi:MAG: glycine zipper 2TM domain-containing protein [Pseudomonadota bacterium]|nr:glycine zipper 2TM domain-containing protein [Pseudomonadota bacterium]
MNGMKSLETLICLVLAGFAITAVHAADFTASARVVSSIPMYQTVTGQECYSAPVQAQPRASSGLNAGSILGGLAGGLLGHQVGNGRGNTAATIIGAVGGAMVGNHVNSNEGQGGSQQQCRDVQKQVVEGYTVRYEYAGHEATTVMQSQPGNTIIVGVTAIQ